MLQQNDNCDKSEMKLSYKYKYTIHSYIYINCIDLPAYSE